MLVAKENDKKSIIYRQPRKWKNIMQILYNYRQYFYLISDDIFDFMFDFLPWADLLLVRTAVTDTPTDTAESGLCNTIILLGCCVFSSGWYNNGTKSTSGSSFPSSAASNIGIGLRNINVPKNKCYEKRILREKKTMRKIKKN